MTAAKAITGFIRSIVLPYLTTVGLRPDSTLEEIITVLVSAAITAAGVYFMPNKKPVNE
jgi:hypothetical protein